MRRVGSSQTEIDNIHTLNLAPRERLQQSLDRGAQPPVEDFTAYRSASGRPLAVSRPPLLFRGPSGPQARASPANEIPPARDPT